MACYSNSKSEEKTKIDKLSNLTGVPEHDKNDKYDCVLVYCTEDVAVAEAIKKDVLTIELDGGIPPKIELEMFVSRSSGKRYIHLSQLKQKTLFICILFSKTKSSNTYHEFQELMHNNADIILPIQLHPEHEIPDGFQTFNYIDWSNKYKLEKFKNIIIEKRKTSSN